MVRISVHEGEQLIRLQIEGTLAGVWVKELELSWRTAPANLRARSLQVDLTGTTFDRELRVSAGEAIGIYAVAAVMAAALPPVR